MSNEWKKFAMEGMLGEDAENVDEKIDEWFFDGFDKPENLKYLPEDEVEEYEKFFDWDCFQMCIEKFQLMEKKQKNYFI